MDKTNNKENNREIIRCLHCKKLILSPSLIGLTLVCPHCSKPVNGQYTRE